MGVLSSGHLPQEVTATTAGKEKRTWGLESSLGSHPCSAICLRVALGKSPHVSELCRGSSLAQSRRLQDVTRKRRMDGGASAQLLVTGASPHSGFSHSALGGGLVFLCPHGCMSHVWAGPYLPPVHFLTLSTKAPVLHQIGSTGSF